MPKILFCATVDFHFNAFHLPYLKWFKEQGWEVHVAAAKTMDLPYVTHQHALSIQRSPFHMKNLLAYKELKKLMKKHQYEVIHCHTPMGGILGRLAALQIRKYEACVLYTAHGFHFYKGAPLLNWLVYYPIERAISSYTDVLITINSEDYHLAKAKLKAHKTVHVKGVGVNTDKFKPRSKNLNKTILGYHSQDFLLIYAGEFNHNKNQQYLIHLMKELKIRIPHAKLLLAGEGPLQANCRLLAEQLGVRESVEFLGYHKDLNELLPLCDVAVASSFREGLPVNVMEAMACGLPIVGTDNRGHRELIQQRQNGFIAHTLQEFASYIEELATNQELKYRMGMKGRNAIMNHYSLEKVMDRKRAIYEACMRKEEKRWIAN
ncbi:MULTISPECIES: glycosyltransferase family 4 protein [Priestia]|uniref:Glycosyl transferase n=1 Tax=Priestia veravalensis TaxID=1414648 RepID=A0A0V8JQ76_9BACI|nr:MULTISPECIES: glycosyltransferase family 4 protein [Priestia]KSU89068.1 glycosyl transferase [Priestia veravalensis]QCS53315.1 glycosyltransferase family 4 protein [Priestia flexa]SCB95194.1 Glycosyltransferase involved in cell wall bisynthesis [Priestia flexa]